VGFWGMDLGCLLDVRSVSLLRKMCTLKKGTELKLLAGLLLVLKYLVGCVLVYLK
jgi:hypothetical protein